MEQKPNSGSPTRQNNSTNRQKPLYRREAKGTDEVTSRVTLLAELMLGEGLTFNSATTKQLQEPNNETDRRKAAFTLAEVLITLGIIGVVAVLTLLAL